MRKRYLWASLLLVPLAVFMVAPAAWGIGWGFTYIPDRMLMQADKDPNNWIHYSRDYEMTAYSPLKQINKDNVKDLVPVWIFPYGVVDGNRGCPIVHQGIIWQTSSWNHVFCIDGRTGEPIWRYDHPLEEDVAAHI